MKLSQLFSIFPHLKWGDAALKDVSSICFDSRKIERGCVFVAVNGAKFNGHDFISTAVDQGAIALVVEDDTRVPKDFSGAIAKVADSRETLNRLCAKFFNDPASRMFCVGVTGTNGKTTTTYMIEAILTEFGWPTGVIGTINHHLGTQVWQTEMTTPDPLSFQRRLYEFETMGARAVAMEVSSHALKQNRVDEVDFDIAVFTNLSRDHLDYHPDMEDYFQAKARLFNELLARSAKPARFAIINSDDEYGRRLAGSSGAQTWAYGSKNADFTYTIHEQDFSGTRFHLKTPRGECHMKLPMAGTHNVENATAAIACGVAAGAQLDTCVIALEKFRGVSGRLEAVPNSKGVHIFVDFAHTDAAIAGILANLNRVRETGGIKNKIITVFGCGGDRDRGKRPLMMKAALAGSDLVVLTSDNPRTEKPDAIMSDAYAGAESPDRSRVIQEVDRKKAIAIAISRAQAGDVVLIAGKGHETYQQIGTQKFPFSDFEVVREVLGS
jgi:UDP-N-acetylmuramoyl-L-alanyl-D-glutamate--2,6-diaminopimelate ligase